MKGSWNSSFLGEVVGFRGGGTPSKKQRNFWGGDIPWVSPKDMKSDVVTTSIDKITAEAVRNSSASLIPAGSLLVVVRSGILARTVPVAMTGVDVTVNQDIKALVPSEKIDSEFLRYFLMGAERELLRRVTRSATVHRLSTDSLKTLRVPLPSVGEQQRIVAKLDKAFAGIAAAVAHSEKNQSNARELFESAVHSVFSERGEGWVESALEDHVKFIDYRGRTPQKTEHGMRLITAKNVKMGFLQEEPREYVDPEIYDEWMTRGIPAQEDVLFTTEAPLGNVAQLDTSDKVVFAQRIIVLQPDRRMIDPAILKYCLLSGQVQRDIHDHGTGATAKGIKSKLLKKIRISYPSSMVEQKRLVERLDALAAKVELLEGKYQARMDSLAELKQSLLQKAFAGELH